MQLFVNTSFCLVTFIMWCDHVEDSMIFEFGNTEQHSEDEFIQGALYLRVENRSLVVHDFNKSSHQGVHIAVNLTPDDWHHIGLCYDFINRIIFIWVNQTLVQEFVAEYIHSFVEQDIINVGYRRYNHRSYYKTTALYYCMQLYNTTLNQVQMSKAAHLCSQGSIPSSYSFSVNNFLL